MEIESDPSKNAFRCLPFYISTVEEMFVFFTADMAEKAKGMKICSLKYVEKVCDAELLTDLKCKAITS